LPYFALAVAAPNMSAHELNTVRTMSTSQAVATSAKPWFEPASNAMPPAMPSA